ncbi:MAG: LamG-like jellyroll fold domain-containing protein [Verrucomicrobiia bacterium]
MESRFVLWLVSFWVIALAIIPPARAAVPVAVATTSWGPMDGFELSGSGTTWWNGGYRGDEVIGAREGQIGINHALSGVFLNRRNGNTFFPLRSRALFAGSGLEQHVARSETDLFFYADGLGRRIFKRPIYGRAESDLGIDFSGIDYSETGAMVAYGGNVFWSVVQGNESQIRTKPLNGGPGGGDVIIIRNIGLAKKMAAVTVRDPNGERDLTRLIILTTAGSIFTYILDGVQNPGPFFLANNVTDFASREESWLEVGEVIVRIIRATKLYVTTGVKIGSDRVAGHLVAFDLTHGGSSTEYQTGDVNLQLTGVAVDDDRLFVTRTPILLGSGLFANQLDLRNSQILRKFSPGRLGVFIPGNFETIALQQEGRNLRSDVQWLYWASGDQVRKIKSDAPAIELDYLAGGVEVIQAVQTFENAIPLVAGKPTLVRAYAAQLKNTTGKTRFPLVAQLRGFLNQVELPGGPIFAYNSPTVDTAGDLPTLRADLNRSFLFELPLEWVSRPGQLRLDYVLNPQGSVPETGPAPLVNNQNSVSVAIVAGRVPNLVFKEVRSSIPNYVPSSRVPGFGDIIDRATRMLPVSHFKIYFSPGSVARPQWTLFGIKDRSFDIPGQENQALAELDEAAEDADDPGPDTHWIGTLPPEIAGFNGLGYTPGNTLLVRMDAVGARGGAWGSVIGGHTLAHELSHNYGRKHIDQTMSPTGCATNRPAGPWDVTPDDPCVMGATSLLDPAAPIGYDWRTDTLILPNQAADMLTYNNTRWISPYTWNALLAAIPAAPAGIPGFRAAAAVAGVHPAIFRVPGIIYPTEGTGVLLPAIQVPAGTLNSTKVLRSLAASAALPADAPYRLRLLGDPQAAPLAEHPIEVKDAAEENDRTLHFVQSIPFLAGVTRIQLIQGGVVLSEIRVTANAPVIDLGVPMIDAQTDLLSLTWDATDADGDALYFSTQFSSDNGSSWHPLTVKDAALGISVSTKTMAGGAQALLRVIATDGVNTTVATTEPFALPKRAPLVSISGITDHQRFPNGQPIFARAIAYDPEDGSLDGTAIHWQLTGPEDRAGTGDTFSMRGLAPGAYTLIVTAADSDGMTSSVRVTLEVRPISVPDASSAPVVDGLCADGAYDSGTVIMMRPNTGIAAPTEVRLVRFEGNVYICFAELSYGSSPASVGIYFDTDGNPTATPQPTDLGFGVSQDGIPSQVAGDGATMVFQPFISSGFKTAVLLGDNAWSAELCIPESLLGGWNHDAGVMLVHYYPNAAEQAKIWPPKASVNNPASYVPASLGPLPPVPNRAPAAVATGPSVILVGDDPQVVGLDGRASHDPDGDPLTYAWLQTAGPTVSLSDAASAQPFFNTPAIAELTALKFQLIVNDGTANSPFSEATVQLTPTPPNVASTSGGAVTTIGNGVVRGAIPWPAGPGSSAVVETSTDLVRWTPLGTFSAGFLSAIAFADADAANDAYRFYRAVEPASRAPAAGKALEFDGTDDWVQVPHADALNAFPFTAAFWVKTADAGVSGRGLVVKYADASAQGYSLLLTAGHVRAWYFRDGLNNVFDGGLGLDSGFIANGQWHYIVFVVDAVSGRLYVDGFERASMAWVGIPGATTTGEALQFGRYNLYPNTLTGQMDEVSIWDRALTEWEIQVQMNKPLTGLEAGLVGYWPLDDGTGVTAADKSGRANDAIFQNAPVWIDSTAPLFR